MSIANEIERLINAKVDIKISIENKGVDVDDNATLDDYADYIDDITTGITPTGTINITQNGITDVTNYANANVNVPAPTPNLQDKQITITSNGTTTISADSGYDGLDEVNITTNVSGGGDIDWTAIGYSGMPQNITDGYNHAIDILNSWDSTTNTFGSRFSSDRQLSIMPLLDIPNIRVLAGAFYGCYSLISVPLFNTENITNMSECFEECRALMYVPKFNTSKVTKMQRMFANCYSLATVPLLDTSAVTGNSSLSNMFTSCIALTDTSLDNILQMCINAVNYTGTKTLRALGIMNTTVYPTSRIEALPHYQNFVNAGWTIGY